MAAFVPRRVYPHLDSIPRSYFLGHHAAGLSKMKTMISQIDLVVECRDYRIPLVSRNPLLEQSLDKRPRLIVYTKRDLGSKYSLADKRVRFSSVPSSFIPNFECSAKKSSKNGMLRLRPSLQT